MDQKAYLLRMLGGIAANVTRMCMRDAAEIQSVSSMELDREITKFLSCVQVCQEQAVLPDFGPGDIHIAARQIENSLFNAQEGGHVG